MSNDFDYIKTLKTIGQGALGGLTFGICYSRPVLKEYELKDCDQTGYTKIVLKSMEQCNDENIIRLSKIQNDIIDLKKDKC